MKSWKLALSTLFGLVVIGAAGYFGFFGFQLPVAPAKVNASASATPPSTVPVSKGDVRQLVSAPGTVVGTQKMNLVTGVQGRIDEVTVRPGDSVKKGQALAKLADPGRYEALVASTHIDLAKAQQDLEDLRANAPKDTADAQTALLKAEDDLTKAKNLVEALKYPRATQARLDSTYNDYQAALEDVAMAQASYDKLAALPPDDPRKVDALKMMTAAQKKKDQLLATYNWLTAKPTDKDKADAQAKLDTAQAVYDAAKRKWERVKNGPDAMALDLAQAKVTSAEKAYAQAQQDLAHLTMTAPFDGIITDVKVAVGDQVTDAAVIMTIVNPKALEAQVTVVEEDYPLIQPGESAQLYFDAQPDAQVTGHVTRIVPSRTSDNQPQYPVYINIDQIPSGLAAGMSVDASIVITEKKDVLVLPKALVRARNDGTATVQVWSNGTKESREIKIGLIGDQSVEILSGLQEGEQVVGQ